METKNTRNTNYFILNKQIIIYFVNKNKYGSKKIKKKKLNN